MKLPTALLRDPLYKKSKAIANTINAHRFQLAELAAEAKAENYKIIVNTSDAGDAPRVMLWSEIIAIANGVDVRRVQEWSQVGEFMNDYKPKTNIYSRVSSAVRYRRMIDADKLVEMIDDIEGAYPTVEALQLALNDIAYAETGYDDARVIRTLYRMQSAGAKLIGLNGDLNADIRADVEEGTRLISRALEYLQTKKEATK